MSELDLNILNKKAPKAKPNNASAGKWKELLNKDIKFGSSSLSDQKREAFYNELSILLDAGLDVRASLEMISQEATKKEAELYEQILDKVIKGKSLSEAIKESQQFSAHEYFSIQIGEETGRLSYILKELASYFKRKIKQRRQIINALSYPVIVLVMAFGAVSFMLYFIVPMFSDVFQRFESDLPVVTQWVIDASAWFSNNVLIIFLVILTLTIGVITQQKKEWFRKLSTNAVLSLPVFGAMIRKIELAKFSSMLALLINSKLPLVQCIQLLQNVIRFYPLEVALPDIEKKLVSGVPLHICLSEYPVFDKKLVALIKVGEEVNKLDEFFERISIQYGEEVDHQTQVLGNLIEPLLLVFLGGVVGFILIAMYLPLFKLSTSFG